MFGYRGRAHHAAAFADASASSLSTISRDGDERVYGRHVTVVRGSVVISAGVVEPRVYD
jgi:hypothetical protein